MKKILKLSLIAALCTCILLSFTGCGKNKKTITADEFKSKMENKGFTVQDSKLEYASRNDIVKSYLATEKSSKYQIDYFELDSVSSAKSMYDRNVDVIENDAADSMIKSKVTTSIANYSWFETEFEGKYMVISRVENTLICASAKSNYKEDIKTILNELGY